MFNKLIQAKDFAVETEYRIIWVEFEHVTSLKIPQ